MPEIEAKAELTKLLVQQGLEKAMTYEGYRQMVSALVDESKSTGPNQTEALSSYTLLNDRRMKRFDKTVEIDEVTTQRIASAKRNITLLVLTESWCGDAAPALPVMHKVAELNDRIDFKIVLRDENVELMNLFLTNGVMSIPKLIFWDSDNKEVLGSWGPRPKPAAQLVVDHKAKYGALLPEIKEEIQIWYNKDKGQTILTELTGLLLK
jgi:thiol-disulfide isomerase/thioredoxin